MSSKTIDQDLFQQVITIGLRMYGNGSPHSMSTIEMVTDYCRRQVREHLLQHCQMLMSSNNHYRLLFLDTLVFASRHKTTRLKRLRQFIQAKDRQEQQQQDETNTMVQKKKISISTRFSQICRQLGIGLNGNVSKPKLDRQRSRQYTRLDAYYKSDALTPAAYLAFVEQQHVHFNRLRSLSPSEILRWIDLLHSFLSRKSAPTYDLRLAEVCLFIIKEILLQLMDDAFRSSFPCQIRDVFRRRHVQNARRLPFSGRHRRFIH